MSFESDKKFIKLLTLKPNKEQLELLQKEKYDEYYSKYGIDIYGFQSYNIDKESINSFIQYEDIINKVLFHFRYLEMTSKNKKINYYNHSEFDSNQSWFEYSGNQEFIGIKSILNYHLIKFLLLIYYSIFDVNYNSLDYYFELYGYNNNNDDNDNNNDDNDNNDNDNNNDDNDNNDNNDNNEDYSVDSIINNMNKMVHKSNKDDFTIEFIKKIKTKNKNCYYLTVSQIIDIFNYKMNVLRKIENNNY